MVSRGCSAARRCAPARPPHRRRSRVVHRRRQEPAPLVDLEALRAASLVDVGDEGVRRAEIDPDRWARLGVVGSRGSWSSALGVRHDVFVVARRGRAPRRSPPRAPRTSDRHSTGRRDLRREPPRAGSAFARARSAAERFDVAVRRARGRAPRATPAAPRGTRRSSNSCALGEHVGPRELQEVAPARSASPSAYRKASLSAVARSRERRRSRGSARAKRSGCSNRESSRKRL